MTPVVAKQGMKAAASVAPRGTGADAKAVCFELDEVIGYNLRRAYSVQLQRFTRVFGPLGIRPVQFSILALVHAHPALKQSELGKRLNVKRANIVTLLDELAQRDLLTRQRSETDRRSHVLALTPAGRKLAIKLLDLHAQLEENLAQELGLRQRDQLLQLLKKFRQLDPQPDLNE